jgi:hypothetical protein
MDQLKLAAIDADDLAVISAHLQDAVLTVGDLVYLARQKRFAFVAKRFAWERCTRTAGEAQAQFERRLTGMHIDRVMAVRTRGIDRGAPETILELLALRFVPGAAPGGTIELVFAAGKDIRLDVECIEAALKDLGPVWETARRPDHPGGGLA